MKRLVELRQLLHRHPEVAGGEEHTSDTISRFLKLYGPDSLITGLGGHGVAATFSGLDKGPTVLIRCELDALPIQESMAVSYCSEANGVAHKCGHDGHMATLIGLAERLRKHPLARGSVVLLFQPAEETGEGAARVIGDARFEQLQPDFALAVHNLPGYDFSKVVLRAGVFASASVGLTIRLKGNTSHAAEPKVGRSPALAVAQLIQSLSSIPQFNTSLHESAQVTIIYAKVGEIAFGTSPGEGVVMATLRSHTQETIDLLQKASESMAIHVADTHDLDVTVDTVQPFPATLNHPTVVQVIADSAREAGLETRHEDVPFPWSEDFGHFTSRYRGALFGFGAGLHHAALHHPDYDFPDDLLEPAIGLLDSVARRLLEVDGV